MKKIEIETAGKILLEADKCRGKVDDETGGLIEKVLRGNHKTYKYILVTALLAKSVNSEIDALSLQAGDGRVTPLKERMMREVYVMT